MSGDGNALGARGVGQGGIAVRRQLGIDLEGVDAVCGIERRKLTRFGWRRSAEKCLVPGGYFITGVDLKARLADVARIHAVAVDDRVVPAPSILSASDEWVGPRHAPPHLAHRRDAVCHEQRVLELWRKRVRVG